MINETILFLPHTGCGDSPLKKYEQELGARVNWDPYIRVGEPLKKVFSRVVDYDFGKNYAQFGVCQTNNEIIDLIRVERPKYVMWPSMSYEILESTFQLVRKEGTLVVGWFFDDECRFNDYSKWWIPYLDYVLTVDKESVKKYRELGVPAMQLLVTCSPEAFRKLEAQKRYDVSFVGSKIADRGSVIDQLRASGIQVQTFGKGWDTGYVSFDEMVNIYNASKINLSFMKSYGINTRPQMKNKIFDICMCGSFLLCEYIPGIEELYELDKEIVCFRDIEEAADKIRYYLSHENEREGIAQAGWERAHRDHTMAKKLSEVFQEIEKEVRTGTHRAHPATEVLEMPRQIRKLPSAYHLNWARALLLENYNKELWKDELDLSLAYDPSNMGTRYLYAIGHLSPLVRPWLIRLYQTLGRFNRRLRSKLYRFKNAVGLSFH